MAAVEIELKDFNKLRALLEKKFGGLVKDKMATGLRSVGEVWMTEAKKRTPVLTGNLRASGHVEGPEMVDGQWQVRLVFGGPAADYAVKVHEDLTAFHRVGQAKYLESVATERRNTLSQEIVAMAIGGGRVYGSMFGEFGSGTGSYDDGDAGRGAGSPGGTGNL